MTTPKPADAASVPSVTDVSNLSHPSHLSHLSPPSLGVSQTPPTRPGEIQRIGLGPLWPPVFGYLAMPFALLSVLVAAWSISWPWISAAIVEANPGSSDDYAGAMRFYRGLDVALMLGRILLAGWLVKLALGLIRRDPASIRTLRTWAIAKLLLEVAVTLLLFAQMHAHFGTRADMDGSPRLWASLGTAAWTGATSIPLPTLLLIWLLTPRARRAAAPNAQNQPALPPNTSP